MTRRRHRPGTPIRTEIEKSERFEFAMSAAMREALDRMARESGWSVPYLIRRILVDHLVAARYMPPDESELFGHRRVRATED